MDDMETSLRGPCGRHGDFWEYHSDDGTLCCAICDEWRWSFLWFAAQLALAVMQDALEFVRDAGAVSEYHTPRCSPPGIPDPEGCGACAVEAALGRTHATDAALIAAEYGPPSSNVPRSLFDD
jgi:hypothetical protein